MNTRAFSPLAPWLLLAGCHGVALPERAGTAVESIDLSALAPADAPLVGVSRDAVTGHLHVLAAGHGVIQLDADGNHLHTTLFTEHGLEDRAFNGLFTDVAALADGTFALALDDEVRRWDPVRGTLTPYFCVVPSSEPTLPLNHAVSLDTGSDVVIAAPARMDTQGNIVSAWHSYYRAADGELQTATDVTRAGIVAEGITRDPETGHVLVVTRQRVHVFAGNVEERSLLLPGVDAATGVALDSSRQVAWVLDGDSRQLRSFSLVGMTR